MAVNLYFLGDLVAGQRYARRGVQIWRSGAVQFAPEEVDVPVVSCLCYDAMCQWHFANIVSCREILAEAISVAKELNDMHAFAVALSWAAYVAQSEQTPAEVDQFASELIELCTRHNFVHFLAQGASLRGWAHTASGNMTEGIQWIEQGIRDTQTTGSVAPLIGQLILKAEALYFADRTSEALETINEAEAVARSVEQHVSDSTIHRLRGVFFVNLGADETQIEASFSAAIRIAREQKSLSLEKRAEAIYAEYRHQKTNASAGRGWRLPLC
jgi:hypothetical protein